MDYNKLHVVEVYQLPENHRQLHQLTIHLHETLCPKETHHCYYLDETEGVPLLEHVGVLIQGSTKYT